MKRHNFLLSTIIGLAALASLAYGGYKGYGQYKADPKGFKKRARRLVEDAVDAYDSAKERVGK